MLRKEAVAAQKWKRKANYTRGTAIRNNMNVKQHVDTIQQSSQNHLSTSESPHHEPPWLESQMLPNTACGQRSLWTKGTTRFSNKQWEMYVQWGIECGGWFHWQSAVQGQSMSLEAKGSHRIVIAWTKLCMKTSFFSSGTLKDCFWFTSWWILW